jgi:hypothetical protein
LRVRRGAARAPLLSLLLAAAICPASATAAESTPALQFEIREGRNLNAFYRAGPVAAHLLLRSGIDPRVLIAFPAGNSGVALWFARQDRPVSWELAKPLVAVEEADLAGRPLRGVEAEVLVNARSLVVKQALLSSVRVLRDYETSGVAPDAVAAVPIVTSGRVSWARDRLDGAAGYKISLEVLGGQLGGDPSGVRIGAADDGPIRLKIRALTGESPLTPLDGSDLLTADAGKDARARSALAFLSYQEKFLAGSWRFNTYFGRDTLMSLRLLMPVLQPAAVESGLLSVLARLAPNGEVAHEEDIGEFAVLRHLRDTGHASAAPIHDYGMIDDDFMLSPVMAAYLLDQPAGRSRASALLDRTLANDVRVGDALVRNLMWVSGQTRAFAAEPKARNLIALKPGRATGQWRDSQGGLGGGRFPYDVNVVFVPAALDAIDRLVRSGLLDPYLSISERAALTGAGRDAAIWSAAAPELFRVRIMSDSARNYIPRYAAAYGVSVSSARAAVARRPVEFDALALDAAARPVPVIHSDAGFSYLFGRPSAAAIERSLSAMMRPFPAGLMTDVGLLVANPVFADPRTRSTLDRTAYHGTVVWAWQQAVLIAGIDRQLARDDLPAPLKIRLRQARNRVRAALSNSRDVRTSELWSWTFARGRYRVAPFGARSADEDESNAAQLWSTVSLAL